MENVIKALMAAISASVSYFFGGADVWLMALVTVIVIDYLTGLAKAYIRGELCSRIGFKGIVKKLMYFAVVAVAEIVDTITGAGGVLRAAVIGFMIANEALSILENYAVATNNQVPKFFVNLLQKVKDDDKKI